MQSCGGRLVCITRRCFGLSLCGAPLPWFLAAPLRADEITGPWDGPALIAKVYLTGPDPAWPTPLLDIKKDVAEMERRLAGIERKLAGRVRLTGGEVIGSADQIPGWAQEVKQQDVDGVLLVPVSVPSASLNALVDAAGVPVLCFSRPYMGHQWASIAPLRRTGRRVDLLASSRFEDLEDCLPAFRAVRQLRRGKILVITNNPKGGYINPAAGFSKRFGAVFTYIPLTEMKAIFEAGDTRLAEKQAEAFTRAALRVVEPSIGEIRDAFRFYAGIAGLMKKEQANAVTLDCFPAVVKRELAAYPCIAWSNLNDRGLYGVCQADVRATMTQLLVTSYSGMPGFVSNPVFDTASNEVIHSHCVAATRMLGLNQPALPYLVRSHLESNEGPVLQVVMPTGRTVTVGIFDSAEKFLVSKAEAVATTTEPTGSTDADFGCRTKLRTRVADADAWVQNYRTGVHRVVFYGDHVKTIQRVGRLVGFEVVKEV